MPCRRWVSAVIGSTLVLSCDDPLDPASQSSDSPQQLLVDDGRQTYVVNAALYATGGSKEAPIGHARVTLVRSPDDPTSYRATFSVIFFANTPTPATTVGFFQGLTPIWSQGEYTSYGPDENLLLFADSVLLSAILAAQIIERPEAFSVRGFDAAGDPFIEGTFMRSGLPDDPRP
jgi:hypothetical protein